MRPLLQPCIVYDYNFKLIDLKGLAKNVSKDIHYLNTLNKKILYFAALYFAAEFSKICTNPNNL